MARSGGNKHFEWRGQKPGDIIRQRTTLPAAYLLMHALPAILGKHFYEPWSYEVAVALPILAPFALVAATVVYELTIPVITVYSSRRVMRVFLHVVGSPRIGEVEDYEAMRHWRKLFFASSAPQELKDDLHKDLELRWQLSFLVASSLFVLAVIIPAATFRGAPPDIVVIQAAFSGIVCLMALAGEMNRSVRVGHSTASAYEWWVANTPSPNPETPHRLQHFAAA